MNAMFKDILHMPVMEISGHWTCNHTVSKSMDLLLCVARDVIFEAISCHAGPELLLHMARHSASDWPVLGKGGPNGTS